MRANMGGVLSYTSAVRLPAQASPKAVCRTTGVCSTDELAEDDLNEWNTALITALPGAVGSIVNEGAGLYSITVSWNEQNRDENQDGVVDAANSSFKVSFRP